MNLATICASFIFLSILIGAAIAQLATLPTNDKETKIFGGTPAAPGAWPAFSFDGCGGALIHPEWVLTVAHCRISPKERDVRIGVETISDPDSGIVRKVVERVYHPRGFTNDIILIKLDSPVTDVTPFVYEKDSSSAVPATDTELTVIGFGRWEDGDKSDILRQVNVNAVSHADCVAAGEKPDVIRVCQAGEFCAGINGDGGMAAGAGDSGGPIVDATTKVIFGLVTANRGNYTVFTRVGFYSDWIDCVIGGGGKKCPSDDGSKKNCPSDGGKKSSSRRRLLSSLSASSLKQEDEDYHSYVKACGHLEYHVSLYVDTDTHLYLVGVPKNEDAAAAAKCPMLGAVHAVMSEHDKATKEIIFWEDHGIMEQGPFVFEKNDLLSVGTFQLNIMARAFETAQVSRDIGPSAVNSAAYYDLITNNCASFLINLAKEMNVSVEAHITSFVAHRLLVNSGKQLADKVRSSLDYLSLWGSDHNLRSKKKEATDEEIVHLLIRRTIANY